MAQKNVGSTAQRASFPGADPFVVEAVITASVSTVTARDVTGKSTEREPAATVTDAGGVAARSLLDNARTSPPDGAGIVTVAVPTLAPPPTTPAGAKVTPNGCGA
jgi:hypothetical protein